LAVLAEVVERMARQIQAEALALRLEPLPLRPLALRRDLVLELVALLAAPEQRRLTRGDRVRGALGELQHVWDRGHQRRTVDSERVERARARERLEHAPIDFLQIDAPTQIEQALDLPAGGALRHDRVDRARTHALERAEPVADSLRASHREREPRTVHV